MTYEPNTTQPSAGGRKNGQIQSHFGLSWPASITIGAAALVWRLLYLAMANAQAWHYFTDAPDYLRIAGQIARGDLASCTPFFRAPLYPAFLAGMLTLMGGNFAAAKCAQAVLGSLTAVLVAVLGARLFGRRVGIVGGLLFGAVPSLMWYEHDFGPAVLLVALTAAALLALWVALDRRSARVCALAGALFGLATITHTEVAVLAMVALVAIWWKRRWAPALAFAGTCAAAVVPVTLCNIIAGADTVLVSWAGGLNLWLGNCEYANGQSARGLQSPELAPLVGDRHYLYAVTEYPQQQMGRRLRPSEISAYWSWRAVTWIRANPGAFVSLTARKAVALLSWRETDDLVDLPFFLGQLRPAWIFPRWRWLLPLACLGLLIPGAARQRTFLAAFGVLQGGVFLPFFVLERFRLPLYIVLCLLAARTIIYGARKVWVWNARKAAPLG